MTAHPPTFADFLASKKWSDDLSADGFDDLIDIPGYVYLDTYAVGIDDEYEEFWTQHVDVDPFPISRTLARVEARLWKEFAQVDARKRWLKDRIAELEAEHVAIFGKPSSDNGRPRWT